MIGIRKPALSHGGSVSLSVLMGQYYDRVVVPFIVSVEKVRCDPIATGRRKGTCSGICTTWCLSPRFHNAALGILMAKHPSHGLRVSWL
jgi:hypothetical protein